MYSPVMSVEDIESFIDRDFPEVHTHGRVFFVEAVRPGEVDMRLDANETHLRPGGTISGPAMMTLADLGAYAVILAHIGPVALAVTTNLNINFLRKPAPGPLRCTARLIKLGKRLAVTDCSLTSSGVDGMVAHATLTYSIPSTTKP